MPKVTHFKGAEPGLEPELSVLQQKLQGRRVSRKRPKENPWVWQLEGHWKAPGTGREVHGQGLRRELGTWGLRGWRGHAANAIQEHTLQNAQERSRPRPSPWSGLGTVLKDLHLFLIPQPHSGKYVPTPYNHLITDIICYDLTTLPDYYSVRKYRNCFHYA